ncbi:U3 snoRNP protein [Tieghemostelium lacteum]|uniref:U3 snoRNP protein n=1 Tax=Tieghemostelium lacteum TaxID=361077 RepID=A0A151Z2N8_TIELA|nr:U3 snoRNP protein [Tieghemostelium lacteum]|eukprot:KYQ88208.1 U3 snoRNP protein [Tieghemostelium lacteum]
MKNDRDNSNVKKNNVKSSPTIKKTPTTSNNKKNNVGVATKDNKRPFKSNNNNKNRKNYKKHDDIDDKEMENEKKFRYLNQDAYDGKISPFDKDGYKLPKNFEDEEIDEDDAFNAEDEEEYSYYFNKNNKNTHKASNQKKKSNKKDDYDDFEGQEDDDEYMDISELLDDDKSSISHSTQYDDDEEEEVDDIEYEQDDEDEDDIQMDGDGDDDDQEEEEKEDDNDIFKEESFDEDEDDDDESESDEENDSKARDQLLSIIKGLEKKPINKQNNKKLEDVTELFGNESQYNIQPTSQQDNMDNLIDIDDLLNIMPEGDGFDLLKDQLKGIKDKPSISTPMTKSESSQIQRKITLEQVNKILTQWAPYIKQQREQPSMLFENRVKLNNSTARISDNFSGGSLNDEIQKSLEDSGAFIDSQKDESGTANNALEDKLRLREIIKLRNLMYYKEQRDKRKKKIKSKKYHKILKKQKEKDLKKKEDELMALDPEYAKHKQAMAEEQRIRERMTLRHKNQSKFMKNVMKGSGMNTEQRQSISEQNVIANELLIKRMNEFKKQNGDESSSDDSDSSETESTKNVDNRTPMNEDLLDIDVNDRSLSDQDRIKLKLSKLGKTPNLPDKGINAMKFMQKSLEKDLDRQLKEREGQSDDFDQLEKAQQEKDQQEKNKIQIHRPIKQLSKNQNISKTSTPISVQTPNDFDSNINNISKKAQKKQVEEVEEDQEEQENEDVEEDNPWIEVKKNKKTSKKEKRKQSNQFLISMNNIDKLNQHQKEIQEIVNGDGKQKQQQSEKVKRKFEETTTGNDNEDDGSAKKKNKFHSMSLITSDRQKQLLLDAFAKDNIEEEFTEEKHHELEEELPEEQAKFIPGWGSWAGEGINDNRQQNEIKRLNQKRQIKLKEMAKKRQDYENSRVIINESSQKEAIGKYVLNNLPHNFNSKEQYESTLSIAHGRDFNTRMAFEQLVQPKVTVRTGTYIQPLTQKDKNQFIQKKKDEKQAKLKKLNDLKNK